MERGALMKIKPNEKVIFIGDSITEDGRFEDSKEMGNGYVRLIDDYIKARYPSNNIQIINKGIGGNRVTDLKNRWEEDVIQQAPDWVSISIGVNDVWRRLDNPTIEQVYPTEFEQVYRQLLSEVKNKTDAQIIIMDPTIIEEDVHSEGNQLLKEYVKITEQLSKDFQAVHIAMYYAFIQYVKEYPENTLTTDGVHMNSLGRMLMAKKWMESMEKGN
ncbi:MAG TPA: SGNH/GDSL hydrolase family protein [Candidatus Dormibacteraeota bacterium]|nr:SGNH/GDSL hydrolase family protein [Candidatus Dormibacteraeota bacterium]